MKDLGFWLYLANAVTLIVHETAYWQWCWWGGDV